MRYVGVKELPITQEKCLQLTSSFLRVSFSNATVFSASSSLVSATSDDVSMLCRLMLGRCWSGPMDGSLDGLQETIHGGNLESPNNAHSSSNGTVGVIFEVPCMYVVSWLVVASRRSVDGSVQDSIEGTIADVWSTLLDGITVWGKLIWLQIKPR